MSVRVCSLQYMILNWPENEFEAPGDIDMSNKEVLFYLHGLTTMSNNTKLA